MPWWEQHAARTVLIAGAVSGVVSISGYVANTAQLGEPWWIAHRGWVRDLTTDLHAKFTQSQVELKEHQRTLERQQLSTTLQVMEGRRETLRAGISQRRLLLEEKPQAPLEYRRLVVEQIASLVEQERRLSLEIDRVGKELGRR